MKKKNQAEPSSEVAVPSSDQRSRNNSNNARALQNGGAEGAQRASNAR